MSAALKLHTEKNPIAWKVIRNSGNNNFEELDYYPFGAVLPGRSGGTSDYRYGMNGQEKDDEIAGVGNSYTAEYWQYDPRLGKRWNIDPVKKHFEGSYVTFRNNPIMFADPNGDDIEVTARFKKSDNHNKSLEKFAGTKEGKDFLKDYAKKGDVIGGVTFNEDGKYHSQGINLQYDLLMTEDGKLGYGSNTDKKIEYSLMFVGGGVGPLIVIPKNELTILVNIGSSTPLSDLKKEEGHVPYDYAVNNEVFQTAKSVVHESFIHGGNYTKDFLDDRDVNDSQISDDDVGSGGASWHLHHGKEYNEFKRKGYTDGSELWPSKAYNALKTIRDQMGIKDLTNEELKQYMWRYEGGIIYINKK
jgi:RHS repeat-associated protein